MITDDQDLYETSSNSTGTNSLDSGSSDSSQGPPDTPAVRRRPKALPPTIRASSNPVLAIPPKLSLNARGSSAAADLARGKSGSPASPSSSSSLDDAMPISPSSGASIKISSPLHSSSGDTPEEGPSPGFMPPLNFGFGEHVLPPHEATPAKHTLGHHTPYAGWKQPPAPSEDVKREVQSHYSPHPNSIAMTTRDIPPKGWRIVNEAGIVVGSAAAYHGSSVSKISTKAMTMVVSTLNEARNVATQNMLKAASHRGCNAILAMKYDTSYPIPEIFLVTAYGTACVIAQEEPP